MENIIQKYKIRQGNKNYNLSTKINKDKLIFIIKDLNYNNQLVYIGEYLLIELKQISSLFSSASNIYEGQIIFDNIMTNQKVSLEFEIDYINLKIFIKKKDGIEEYFSLKLNLQNKFINSPKLIYLPKNVNHHLSNENITKYQFDNKINKKIFYSPINFNKRKYIQLPTRNIKNLNISNNNINSNINNISYNYYNLKNNKSKHKLILSLSPQQKINNYNSSYSLIHSISAKNINRPLKIYTESNIKNKELENLKIENNILKNEINKLRDKNKSLIQENKNLKINKEMNNKNESIIISLKKEIENYIKEINILKNKLYDLEEHKKIKIKEIELLNVEIKDLLINISKLKENENQKEKEINNLKFCIDELLKKEKKEIEKEVNMKKEILTIQDSRTEIIKGDIIENIKELELLTRKICKNNRKVIMNLLYKATIDSDKAEMFHKKCDSANKTLVLIRSENNKRFGGYTTCNWEGNSIEKEDNNAFIFSLDKMNIYDIIPGENAIGCYPKYGPIFLGCQIRIYDQFFTRGGTTFEKETNYLTKEDYELTGGLEKFQIKEIEVYGVEIE